MDFPQLSSDETCIDLSVVLLGANAAMSMAFAFTGNNPVPRNPACACSVVIALLKAGLKTEKLRLCQCFTTGVAGV